MHLAHVGLGREGTGDARQYVSEKRWGEEQGQKNEDGKKREGGNSGHARAATRIHELINGTQQVQHAATNIYPR